MANSLQALLRYRLPARALPALRRWLGTAGRLLPGACALCAATGPHVVCAGCRAQFFSACDLRCSVCALPLPGTVGLATRCGNCLRRPPAFDATVAAADYAAPVDQLVLGLKFGAKLALAPLFSDVLRDALLGVAATGLPLPDCLAPVPLGRTRLQERGFNQALEIARPLSALLGVPLAATMLVRVRDTAPQSQLSPLARQRNLQGAFTLAPQMAGAVRGRHIGIVDDVMTTGATANELAATLKRFGAARVTCLVVARTLPKY